MDETEQAEERFADLETRSGSAVLAALLQASESPRLRGGGFACH